MPPPPPEEGLPPDSAQVCVRHLAYPQSRKSLVRWFPPVRTFPAPQGCHVLCVHTAPLAPLVPSCGPPSERGSRRCEQAADGRAAEGHCVVWGWTESGVGELSGRCTTSHSDRGSVRAQPHPQGSTQPPTAPASSLRARGLAGATRLSPLWLHTFVNTQGAPPCAGLCLGPRTL